MPDKDQYKDTKSETIQVFDGSNMPYMFGKEELPLLVTSGQGVDSSDCYCRWYPKKPEDSKQVGNYCFFKTEQEQQAGLELNKWLLAHGMIWDKSNEYFHILIHID